MGHRLRQLVPAHRAGRPVAGPHHHSRHPGVRSAHQCPRRRPAYARRLRRVDLLIRDERGDLESRAATLSIADPSDTLWDEVWERLPQTFPAAAFLSSLTLLTLR